MSNLVALPARCAVCDHSEAKMIDGMIANHASAAGIAERFGLSPGAVSRHLALCKSRGRERYGDSAESILLHLVELKEICEQRLANANAKDSAGLVDKMIKIDSEILRISGLHRGCMSQSEWDRMRQAIVVALRQFPQALEAVSAAIEKLHREGSQ